MNIDFSELEEQFAAKNPVKNNTTSHSSPSRAVDTAPPAKTVLDIDRARNVGVLMRSLKMDARGIEAALHATLFNDGSGQRTLEEFEIEGILAAFPTAEEERQLNSMGCEPVNCVSFCFSSPLTS